MENREYYNQIKLWAEKAINNIDRGLEPENATLDAIQTYINRINKIN